MMAQKRWRVYDWDILNTEGKSMAQHQAPLIIHFTNRSGKLSTLRTMM